MSGYIDRETLERCVERGAAARMPLPGVQYSCFVDAASGSGTDSFAVAIGHKAKDADRDVLIVDAVVGNKPPFNPLAVIAGFVGVLQRWKIREVFGDDYAGNFLRTLFAKHHVEYRRSALSASELYLAALPVFTSGSVVLPDVPGLITEFVNLRRKVGATGRDTVAHMRGYHDDAANAVCGLIHLLTPAVATGDWWNSEGENYIGAFTTPRVIAGVTDAAYSTEPPHAPSRSYYRKRAGGPGSVVW